MRRDGSEPRLTKLGEKGKKKIPEGKQRCSDPYENQFTGNLSHIR
jgi:hypothetical protein